jgi:dienelactone hydrolase
MMKKITAVLFGLFFAGLSFAQQSYEITFPHDGITVNGTITTPEGTGKFPVIIINPGSGANDRNGTIPMVGGNAACLYPELLNQTLKPYKELSDALVDSGYAVLRYDKLEYTNPTSLGTITFHKLWLPVSSAIDYVKTRDDVDTNQIILIGHSEGSTLIPYIAHGRQDVKALISIAGARTPFDSLLAQQLVNLADSCNGNVPEAQMQASQILAYFNLIRTNAWDANTPPLFGAPASTWYDYVRATDSVSHYYNLNNLPTLFTGMALDFNVPPVELERFQEEVVITNDFWSMPGLIHYMTPNNDPHVSKMLTDTIIYWLRQHNFATGIQPAAVEEEVVKLFPNPFQEEFSIKTLKSFSNLSLTLFNTLGKKEWQWQEEKVKKNSTIKAAVSHLPAGTYFLEIATEKQRWVKKIIKLEKQ